MFYTDEEDDDIFVGSDDEYKEMVKVAINKNKVWNTYHTSELVGELAALNLRHRNLGIRAFDHAQYDAPPAPSPWLCFSGSKLYHSSLYNLIQLNKTIQINPGWPNQICTGYQI